jgi:hypothetical protein
MLPQKADLSSTFKHFRAGICREIRRIFARISEAVLKLQHTLAATTDVAGRDVSQALLCEHRGCAQASGGRHQGISIH